jgi:hypothetical protein
MNKKATLALLAILIGVYSCTLQKGSVIFTPPKDELTSTNQIKEFIKTNPNPTIVVKTFESENYINSSDPNSYIYTAIEKKLTALGFKVKDRNFFNDEINKSNGNSYDQIRTLSDLDLVIEVVKLETNKKFITNRLITSNGKEKTVGDDKILTDYNTILRFGAVIEYRLLIVKKNEYGGSYLFYYTPCVQGNNDCNCIVAYKDSPDRIYSKKTYCNSKSTKIFDFIDQNVVEDFIEKSVNSMIHEIKN